MNYGQYYINFSQLEAFDAGHTSLTAQTIILLIEQLFGSDIKIFEKQLAFNTLIKYKILMPIESKSCGNCDCPTNEQCTLRQKSDGEMPTAETAQQVEA